MVQQIKSNDECMRTMVTPRTFMFVGFYATWCGPCANTAPEFERLNVKHPNCTFIKVDISEIDFPIEDFYMQSFIAFTALRNGNKVKRLAGANPENFKKLVIKIKPEL